MLWIYSLLTCVLTFSDTHPAHTHPHSSLTPVGFVDACSPDSMMLLHGTTTHNTFQPDSTSFQRRGMATSVAVPTPPQDARIFSSRTTMLNCHSKVEKPRGGGRWQDSLAESEMSRDVEHICAVEEQSYLLTKIIQISVVCYIILSFSLLRKTSKCRGGQVLNNRVPAFLFVQAEGAMSLLFQLKVTQAYISVVTKLFSVTLQGFRIASAARWKPHANHYHYCSWKWMKSCALNFNTPLHIREKGLISCGTRWDCLTAQSQSSQPIQSPAMYSHGWNVFTYVKNHKLLMQVFGVLCDTNTKKRICKKSNIWLEI